MKAFSRHQLDLLEETIVSIMWKKREVMDFFRDSNVSPSILSALSADALSQMTKRQLIRQVFEELNKQSNRGTPELTLMATRLSDWTTFNYRYFEVDKTLDRDQAEAAINSLRTSLGLRARTNEQIDTKQASTGLDYDRLQSLSTSYLDLLTGKDSTISPQARGFEFERLLNDLFVISGIPAVRSFRVNGMQIDGSFKFENHNYLLEAKWTHKSESAEPVFFFSKKFDGNMDGRGLFISVNGFTEQALLALSASNVRNVALMDGTDLFYVLDSRISLEDCLARKIDAAQTRGDIYFDPLRMTSKYELLVKLRTD